MNATGVSFGGLQPGLRPAPNGDSDCINDPAEPRPRPPDICSNSNSRDTTTCSGESPCVDGGDLWSKYNLLGCYMNDNFTPPKPFWVYNFDDKVCSTADKCGDANGGNVGPTLNAGFCNCSVGATYKTCCSGADVGNSCVQQNLDTTNPPFEGVCPAGTTTEPCGPDPAIYAEMGKPFTNVACGQATCAQLAPPPPPARYSCVNNSCAITANGTYPDLTTCNANCNTSCPNFAPNPTTTVGSCPANTTCIAQQPSAKKDGGCSPGNSCTRQCAFTCVDSVGNKCPAITCQTTWACDAAGSGYVNDGKYYYTCPASCPFCPVGATRTVCGTQQNACRIP